jgi:hypothetical protein
MRTFVSTVVVVCTFLAAAWARAERPYYYSQVAIGGSGSGNGLSFLSPLINNNGTVAFYATKAGVGNGILTGPSFENNAIFNETGVGPYSGISSSFALNDSGQIAVKATVRATGQGGIFVHDDTAHNLMAGWGTLGSSPLALTNNGKVAIGATYGLYTYNPLRNHDIFLLGQAGVSDSVRVGENTSAGPAGTFRRLEPGTYIVNEAGQNAFMAQAWDEQINGRIEGIYQDNSTSSAIVDARGRFFDNDDWLDMNNAGTLAFAASTDDDLFHDGIFRGRGEDAQLVASTGADYSQFSFVDINDSGATAFGAHVTNSPSYGVFTGPSNVNDRVAGPGDQLFGKTVRDAYFRRGGLNNQGQVAFEYITTDLLDVIAVATPATMGDANVDQTVNLLDFNVLAENFGRSAGVDWRHGEFTGDGVVDLADFNALAGHFGLSASGSPLPTPQDWSALAAAAVPEPSLAAPFAGASCALLRFPRRRR